MAYKHVIRAKTKNLMTDEMFTSAGFTKQPDGSWYVPNSTVLHNKVLWENTEGIAGPFIISLYGKSPQPNAAGIIQFLVTFTDGDIQYINGTGSSDAWEYSVPTVPNPTKTIAKIQWANITGRPLYLRDVMFEWGSTPTPYTPYNYLSSNKRMIKVSDVCQLYAKNIWREGNFYGVSIKNNNDGSITLNGTATESFFYTNMLDYEIKPNHVYFYFDAYNEEPSWSTYVGGCEGKVNHESAVMFAIYNLNNDGTIMPSSPTLPSNTLLNTFCMCYKGFTLNNVTIKPQLFDLTEMFGAGHEPATVAEFRQRFPNEYYPYSPQCWLTSYKSAVVCKTKNLFDYKTTSTDNPTGRENVELSLHEDYLELSGTQQTGKFIELGWDGFNIPFEIGKTYTLSADTKIPGFDSMLLMRVQYTDGQSPSDIWEAISWNLSEGTVRKIFTPTRPGYFDRITYFNPPGNHFSGDYIFRVQLEQGSTATSYVPYQHL